MSEAVAPVIIPEETGEPAFRISVLLVWEGQEVRQNQALARLEGQNSPDSSIELLSPQGGYVTGLHAATGQMARAGEILCYICSQPSIPAQSPGQTAIDPAALIIFGGGGQGKTIIDLVRGLGAYRIVGIFDDGLPAGSQVMDVPVLGGAKDLPAWRSRGIGLAVNGVGGIGNVAVRLKVFDTLEKAGFAFPAVIHPSAVIERSAVVEPGVQILAQAYVGSAARIGFGSVLNAGVIVSHDCVVGRVVNLSPGATLAGEVRVNDHAQIGMCATVNLQLTVGAGALLGNGCTVKADVPAGARVRAGAIWPIPAQKIG